MFDLSAGRHCERTEAIQGQTRDDCSTCPWIASSLSLLAMTASAHFLSCGRAAFAPSANTDRNFGMKGHGRRATDPNF
jgi:hypothetical protein